MMIEGGGAEEKPSSAVASSWDRESDGGDDLSHYSSCGGESEFDRYCSASSAMGTPSFRGSSYQDPDFGSFKLGDENANFKNIGADREVLLGYQESECGALNLNGEMEGFAAGDADMRGNLDVDGNWGIRVSTQNENEGNSEGNVGISDKGCYRSVVNGGEDMNLSDEAESSSRYEHSDGEDSMFGCDIDDGKKIVSYYGKNVPFCGGENERKENQLVMNSSVAFGSDDWDDFVQESRGNTIGSMVWDQIQADNRVTYRNTVIEGRRDEVNDMDELEKEVPSKEKLKIRESESEVKIEGTITNEVMAIRHGIVVLNNKKIEKRKIKLDSLSESRVDYSQLVQAKVDENKEAKLFEDNSSFASPSCADTTKSGTTKKTHSFAFDQIEDHFVPVKTRDFELNDLYDEIVNDMEDILLDSGEPPASRFTHGTKIYQSHFSQPSRDGSSTASTSHANNWIDQPLKIDKIEVVGASQRKGDVSFSERLVGVQKHTVYKIRVWSGDEHWEVERRYRDFSTLYHRLKKQFDDHRSTLPSPWFSIERESRKLFGNASPNVIADRSILIQECLQSVIHPKFTSVSLNALVSFLSPSETVPDSPNTNKSMHVGNLGKTISLVVEIRPSKSVKQMLDAQHYRCAGCHRNFDGGKTRVLEFVQALGWGKPRLCEYSGQLFCASCHNNDTAVLPARVLHYWDFTWYPVSQMAKSFLDSINDQPMLCVSAVNPFLFSKVPTLQHVANTRCRIRAMLPYVRCPFRRSIYKGLGSRSYLLESNDFFALKDLISLSKGVFSALPVMVETVSRKIQEHITEQCLVCYDVGIPCSARQDCNNPLSLIFPFQEGEVEKCRSCELIFHKNCVEKLSSCRCGARFKQEETKQSSNEGIHSENINLKFLGKTAEPSTGFLAGLFSKVMPGRSQVVRKHEPKRVDNVILMGSIPNASL